MVSRESAVLGPISSIGEANSWRVESATSGWGAIERVESGVAPDLVILDVPRGDVDGLHFLRWLRRICPELSVILICEPDDTPKKQEAIRLGARDCLFRPVDNPAFEGVIRRHLFSANDNTESDITSDDVERIDGEAYFVGASPIMRRLRTQAASLAASDAPVLILGESGSGKRTIGRLIHQLSVRSGFPFAAVNCAALPCEMLESELFGYERNGDGRSQLKSGKLELCNKGTICLDEITEMPMVLQAKLLHLLQNKTFARPGSGTTVPVDVRILAASAPNIESAVSAKKLREDLYYRLSAYTVHVPPLRERREEVPLLMHYFMRFFARQYDIAPRTFSPAVLEVCQSHSWLGNLRELQTFVKRYLLAGGAEFEFVSKDSMKTANEGDSSVLAPAPTPVSTPRQSGVGAHGSDSLKSLVQTVKLEAERNAIATALKTTGWNRAAAARLLKVSYRTLLYKIEQYQMRSPDSALLQMGAGVRPSGGFGGNGEAD